MADKAVTIHGDEQLKQDEATAFVVDPELERRLVRKLDLRILPTLWVMVGLFCFG
jgi:hypothetical protein